MYKLESFAACCAFGVLLCQSVALHLTTRGSTVLRGEHAASTTMTPVPVASHSPSTGTNLVTASWTTKYDTGQTRSLLSSFMPPGLSSDPYSGTTPSTLAGWNHDYDSEIMTTPGPPLWNSHQVTGPTLSTPPSGWDDDDDDDFGPIQNSEPQTSDYSWNYDDGPGTPIGNAPWDYYDSRVPSHIGNDGLNDRAPSEDTRDRAYLESLQNFSSLSDDDFNKMFIMNFSSSVQRHILATQLSFCPNVALCSHTLNIVNIGISSSVFELSCCGFCSCDTNWCLEEGNCCPDAMPEPRLFDVAAHVRPSCIPMILRGDGLSSPDNDYFQISDEYGEFIMRKSSGIAECPYTSAISDSQKCVQNYLFGDVYLRDVLPVWHNKSNTLYRNIHCALCNSISASELDFLEPHLGCRGLPPTFQTETELLKYVLTDNYCEIGFKPKHFSLPHCDLIISKCNLTGRWEIYDQDYENACRMYESTVSIQEGAITFKNVFCALCNGYAHVQDEMYCGHGNTKPSVPYSFSGLMAFSSHSDTGNSHDHEQCGSGFIYHTVMGECVPVRCSPLRNLVGSECVPLMESLTKFDYNAALRLTPSATHTVAQMRDMIVDLTSTLRYHLEDALISDNQHNMFMTFCSATLIMKLEPPLSQINIYTLNESSVVQIWLSMNFTIEGEHQHTFVVDTLSKMMRFDISYETGIENETLSVHLVNGLESDFKKGREMLQQAYATDPHYVYNSFSNGISPTVYYGDLIVTDSFHSSFDGSALVAMSSPRSLRTNLNYELTICLLDNMHTHISSLLPCPLILVSIFSNPWTITNAGVKFTQSGHVFKHSHFYISNNDTLFLCKDQFFELNSGPPTSDYSWNYDDGLGTPIGNAPWGDYDPVPPHIGNPLNDHAPLEGTHDRAYLVSLQNYSSLSDDDVNKMFIMNFSSSVQRRILATQLSYCPNVALCSHTLNIVNMGISSSCCGICSCDTDWCLEGGNCCPDAMPAPHLFDVPAHVRPSCIPMILRGHGLSSPDNDYFQISDVYGGFMRKSSGIAECPYTSAISDSQKCVHNYLFSDVSLRDVLPVWHNTSNTLYRNIHCALCNSMSASELDFLAPHLGCHGPPPTFQTETELLKYVLTDNYCEIGFKPKRFSLPRCDWIISKCNLTGRWEIYDLYYEIACRMYESTVSIQEGAITFKNVFCALCNGYAHVQDEMYCGHGNTKPSVPYSFSGLMAFSSHSDTGNSHDHEQCGSGFIYHTVMGECVPVRCSPQRNLVGSECVPLMESLTKFDYNAALRLTPSATHTVAQMRDMIVDLTSTLRYHLEDALISDNQHNMFMTFCSATLIMKLEPPLSQINIYTLNESSVVQIWLSMNFTIEGEHQHTFVVDTLSKMMRFDISYDTDIQNETLSVHLANGLESDFEKGREMLQQAYATDPHYVGDLIVTDSFYSSFDGGALVAMSTPQYMYDTKCKLDNMHTPISSLLPCPLILVANVSNPWTITNAGVKFTQSGHVFKHSHFYISNNDTLFLCKDQFFELYIKTVTHEWSLSAEHIVSLICSSLAIISLLVTLTAFSVLPQLRNLPGKNNMALVVVLLMAQVFYLVGSFSRLERESAACKLVGLLTHFFWLLVVFWMNVCTFHMFRALTKTKIISRGSGNKKYLLYHVYCIVASATFVGINVLVSSVTSKNSNIGYGVDSCYVSSQEMLLYTFGIPLALVIVSNLVMFIFVIISIKKTSVVQKSVKNERNDIAVFARLSTLTGTTWLVGFFYMWTRVTALSYIFILLNASQGIFLFVSFICTRRVLNMAGHKYLTMSKSQSSVATNRASSREGRTRSVDKTFGNVASDNSCESNDQSKHSKSHFACPRQVETTQCDDPNTDEADKRIPSVPEELTRKNYAEGGGEPRKLIICLGNVASSAYDNESNDHDLFVCSGQTEVTRRGDLNTDEADTSISSMQEELTRKNDAVGGCEPQTLELCLSNVASGAFDKSNDRLEHLKSHLVCPGKAEITRRDDQNTEEADQKIASIPEDSTSKIFSESIGEEPTLEFCWG